MSQTESAGSHLRLDFVYLFSFFFLGGLTVPQIQQQREPLSCFSSRDAFDDYATTKIL